MSNEEIHEKLPAVKTTEPTIETLVRRLNDMDATAYHRHAETLTRFAAIDDRFTAMEQAADRRHAEIVGLFRKQHHAIDALNQNILTIQADNREIFERLGALESA